MTSQVSRSDEITNPRVLILSFRNILGKDLFRCPHYEFEDIIHTIDFAELFAPKLESSNRRYRLVTELSLHAPVILNPGITKLLSKRRYDIFFTICGVPQDLLVVNAIGDLRSICKTSVCLLDEFWLTQLAKYRHYFRILTKFDVVMIYYSKTVKHLSEQIDSRCVFLPSGIDAILFSPYPNQPERVVDVYSIGRRSEVTHQRLLRMVQESDLFYLHDSIGGHLANNSKEHRALFASIAKRSRYFIVNPGKIDLPDVRGNQIEVSNRYFEGAASGTIMIGERPTNEVFEKLFDWPEAVIQLPYDSGRIDRIIKDLDGDPTRQDSIRRANVIHILKHHDWVYRWEKVLNAVGLEPMQGLLQRKERLWKLAEVVSQDGQISSVAG